MKRISLAVIALMLTPSALAGVVYDVSMVSEAQGTKTTMAGTAWVDEGKTRTEMTEGDGQVFEDGTVMISNEDGSVYVLDPSEKTYWKLDIGDLFNQMGAMMEQMGSQLDISIDPEKVEVREIGAGEKIDGYSTRKFEVETDYTIAVDMMGMSMKTKVSSDTIVWATDELDYEYGTIFQSQGLKTGMPELDELLESYAVQVEGFPLRSETTASTEMMGRKFDSTSSMRVSNIREESIDASKFVVPSDYSEVDSPMKAMMGR